MSHKKLPENRVKTVSFCAPPDLLEKIAAIAPYNQRSALIVQLIRAGLAAHGK